MSSEPNMATTPVSYSILHLAKKPEIYVCGDDLDDFLEECHRFFEITQTPTELRNMYIKVFLSKEAQQLYEEVASDISDYQERCKIAFDKSRNLADDLSKALNYRKGSDSAQKYFKKIDTFVDKILSHKLNKTELTTFLLIHCLGDKNVKKEMRMRDVTKSKDIKDLISKLEEIEKEDIVERQSIEINAIKSTYADVMKRNNNEKKEFRQKPMDYGKEFKFRGAEQLGRTNQRNENGEKSFRETRVCWACHESGHIRRECPNIRCSLCRQNGHLRRTCYRNMQRNQNSYRNVQGNQNSYVRNYRYNDKRYPDSTKSMAVMNEEDNEDYKEYPNAYAPSVEEVVGAIH